MNLIEQIGLVVKDVHVLNRSLFRQEPDSSEENQSLLIQMIGDIARKKKIIIAGARNSSQELYPVSSNKKGTWIAIAAANEGMLVLLESYKLIFFPKPEHALIYYQAGTHSKAGGPATEYPGSVGILKCSMGSKVAYIDELHSSVNHADLAVKDLLEKSCPHNLRNYYSHWRNSLMKQAISLLYQAGAEVIRIKSSRSPDLENAESTIDPELIRCSSDHYVMSEDPYICRLKEPPIHWIEFRRRE